MGMSVCVKLNEIKTINLMVVLDEEKPKDHITKVIRIYPFREHTKFHCNPIF